MVNDGAATSEWEQAVGRPMVCLIGLKEVEHSGRITLFNLFEAAFCMNNLFRRRGCVSHVGYRKFERLCRPTIINIHASNIKQLYYLGHDCFIFPICVSFDNIYYSNLNCKDSLSKAFNPPIIISLRTPLKFPHITCNIVY